MGWGGVPHCRRPGWLLHTSAVDQQPPTLSTHLSTHIFPSRSLSLPLKSGEVPLDHEVVRQAAALTKRLPAVDSQAFGQDYTTVRCRVEEQEEEQGTCLACVLACSACWVGGWEEQEEEQDPCLACLVCWLAPPAGWRPRVRWRRAAGWPARTGLYCTCTRARVADS